MDPNSFRMFMAASSSDLVLPAIGAPFKGGFYAGLISHTANSVATHALIVAPRDDESLTIQFKTTASSTSGTSSVYDGAANTANMNNNDHPAAKYCADYTGGGYTDWYLPAVEELNIAYFNLKPGTQNNYTSDGINDYSVPARTSNYTTSDPAQTSVTAFQTGGDEAFRAGASKYYWSSTQFSSPFTYTAMYVRFRTGEDYPETKTTSSGMVVRPFRKVAL